MSVWRSTELRSLAVRYEFGVVVAEYAQCRRSQGEQRRTVCSIRIVSLSFVRSIAINRNVIKTTAKKKCEPNARTATNAVISCENRSEISKECETQSHEKT